MWRSLGIALLGLLVLVVLPVAMDVVTAMAKAGR
jgi:hypothetical protein